MQLPLILTEKLNCKIFNTFEYNVTEIFIYILRQSIDALIKSQASFAACKQPNLPVDSPEIMKYVKEVPKIDCSKAGEDWVKCEVSELYLL